MTLFFHSDDVDEFLDALKNQLHDAIAKGERIQIR